MCVTQRFVSNKVCSKHLKPQLLHTTITWCCPFATANCEIVFSLNFPISSDLISPWNSFLGSAPSAFACYPVYPEFLGCVDQEETGGFGTWLEYALPSFNTISYFTASSQELFLCLCSWPSHIAIELCPCLCWVVMSPGFLISSPLYTILLLLQLLHKPWVTYSVSVMSSFTACPTSPWLFRPLITSSTVLRSNLHCPPTLQRYVIGISSYLSVTLSPCYLIYLLCTSPLFLIQMTSGLICI